MMKNMPATVRSKVYGSEYVSREFAVEGFVARPRTFTAAELRLRPQVAVGDVPLLCGSGKVKDANRTLTGVLLRDILDDADIRIETHEDPNRTFIVATGTDGYSALFSWHEIFNTAVGDGILVSLEKDGQPLDEKEGELCLVSTRDERPGPRRIRYLSRIDVRRL